MKRKLLTLTLTLLCFLTLSQIHAQEHKYKKYEAKMVGEWQVSDVQARKPVLKSKKNTVSPTATSHINSFKGSTATLNEDGTITFKTGEGKLYSGEWDITKEMERSIGQGMGTGNYDQYYMNMVAKLA
ncbi:MAG: hypothetical protein KDC11_13410, partial [Chitinophagaceae bacterium]|nr:hypothetical protein [Chitinophagaceae bacterium]